MSATPRIPALAPFTIRSYRFQWPADMATSWAFEMESVILGWYVLVETRSVMMLTVFASLLYLGTLLAPMFGVMGDRVGQRNVLCTMRAIYTTLAMSLMVLSFTGNVTPGYVLVIAGVLGIVRPSDVGMRAALVAVTMPRDYLMGAMSIQRTTLDSARIAGALTGAGLVAALGMSAAYLIVTSLYATSTLLTLQVGPNRRPASPPAGAERPSPWRDLREGAAYVWNTPVLLGTMWLALLLNFTAFPQFVSLMPVMVKEVYGADQTTLGYVVASGAFGALLGSITLSRHGSAMPPARTMVIFSACWYAMLLVFAHTPHPGIGIPVLIVAGLVHSMGQIPMAALLLRSADPQFRGRVMGIRMLALYSNLPGLLLAGQLVPRLGYPETATLYSLFGLGGILLIAVRWRHCLWDRAAPANAR